VVLWPGTSGEFSFGVGHANENKLLLTSSITHTQGKEVTKEAVFKIRELMTLSSQTPQSSDGSSPSEEESSPILKSFELEDGVTLEVSFSWTSLKAHATEAIPPSPPFKGTAGLALPSDLNTVSNERLKEEAAIRGLDVEQPRESLLKALVEYSAKHGANRPRSPSMAKDLNNCQ